MQTFYNDSPFTLCDLQARAKQQQFTADFEAFLNGFSPNVQEILDKFKFRNQIPTLVDADALGPLIEKFLNPDINLSPHPVRDADGIQSTTDRVYDGACGTGGMPTVAEETLLELAGQRGKNVSIHLFGQEVNPETYTISKADLLLKGEGRGTDNIKLDAETAVPECQSKHRDFVFTQDDNIADGGPCRKRKHK